jgi:phosphatidate cytidylyltransferase
MLRTRLWMGSILIGVAAVLLAEDRFAAPYFPVFFGCLAAAILLGARELRQMIPAEWRPRSWPCNIGLLAILAANAVALSGLRIDVFHSIGLAVVAAFLLAMLWEMAAFRGPDRIVPRLGATSLVFLYLGVLPSFFIQLRLLPLSVSTAALALAVFVPKCGDIGAYFTGKFLTGRLLGRHPMTPLLSPKKTWQGLAGGLLASIGIAILIDQQTGILNRDPLKAALFGLAVGIAGVLGDLAESLIKRDLETKDASQTIPGFGGVLDVIDSLLFAAPVAYLLGLFLFVA